MGITVPPIFSTPACAPKPPVTDNAPKHRELKVKADPNAKAVTAPAGSIKEYVLKKLGKM